MEDWSWYGSGRLLDHPGKNNECQDGFQGPFESSALKSARSSEALAGWVRAPPTAVGTGWAVLPGRTERAAETEIYDGHGLHDITVRS